MKLDECVKRIDRYLLSSDSSPRFVNLQNTNDLSALIQHYDVGSNCFIPIVAYAQKDEDPKIDMLQNELHSKSGNIFVTGLPTQLKLQGERTLINELQNLASQSYMGHIIFLCYQCESYLRFTDSRLNRLVYWVDGVATVLPSIIFVAPQLSIPYKEVVVDGVQDIAKAIESSVGGNLYVRTGKQKASYPNSLYLISEESDAFTTLLRIDMATNVLDARYGTDEQWGYVLQKINQYGSWDSFIAKEFGACINMELLLSNWPVFDEKKKWLYFIALKLYGTGDNWCLQEAVQNTTSMNQLVRSVYRSILAIPHDSADYWIKYRERRKLLEILGSSDDELLDYLKMVKSKEADALYYLTDLSRLEKEMIFELLDRHASQFTRSEVEVILSHVYPDLYQYLQPYPFKDKLLYTYFEQYKYQKVTNKIFPDFLDIVEEQAKRRDYNLLLSPRSVKIEDLNKIGARLYFVDAMGVEYLSFVLGKCHEKQLMADISICRCELPSITKINKEFLVLFDDIAPDIKRLDSIKHHGEESFDYQTTKLPVHLIRELEIVDEVLTDIKTRLARGTIERAYIISDHGSSRLAVIHESECQWEMASKGEHSGRCCPVDEADVQSEYATETNNFWVLANYDRFKGGRKASVEVHGGATLEEVTVPIIELTLGVKDNEINITTPLPIEVSFRKKAEIRLFSKNPISNVTVRINGRNINDQFYDAQPQNNNLFFVHMPEVKQPGTYCMDVYSNDNLVASELEFTVQKEGSQEKDLL